ncbi:MAG: hypothetical protein E7350_01715 [Clostridiales bacterium]|nr:hypothetical protein [Clostridiales bacterium]
MKKIISIILFIIISAFSLSGCGLGKMKIEDYEWTLRYAFHVQGDQVIVDAVQEYDAAHPQAKVVDITLTARDGKITITDGTNGRTYEGAYTVELKHPDGTDYDIVIDGKSGHATVGMTTFAGGSEAPTLPISVEHYSLYFYAE